MRRFWVLVFSVAVLALSGCHSGIQHFWTTHIYPFSREPCPYYNYQSERWMPSPGSIQPPVGFPLDEDANPSPPAPPDDTRPQELESQEPESELPALPDPNADDA